MLFYMRIYFFGFFILGAAMMGCKSTKIIHNAIVKKDTTATMIVTPVRAGTLTADTLHRAAILVDSMELHHFEFNTFMAKMKVDYANQKGKQPDFTAYVRMKRDSLIWISLTSDLGIEGIRLLITPERIQVMDKLAKTIQDRPLSALKEISQIPFTFSDIQHLLLGRAILFEKDSIDAYATKPNQFLLAGKAGQLRHVLLLNKDYLPEKSTIDDVNPALNRRVDVTYKDYELKNGIFFSKLRELLITYKERMDIQLRFKEYLFDQPLTYPFTVPKKFTNIP
jgi:hypothetical protein